MSPLDAAAPRDPKAVYAAHHRRSLEARDAFWAGEAARLRWTKRPETALDYARPPFAHWFPDGELNLCDNAVDRWAETQPDAAALIAVSTETDQERVYSFAELKSEVSRWASILRAYGADKGDRVLIYMPMIAEAVFAMLACARIGAVHSVVFGGFASHALASRIDDATPKLVVTADAGSRAGKAIAYKPLLDGAIDLAAHKPDRVILVDRGLAPFARTARDIVYQEIAADHAGADIAPVPLPSGHPSYILYTSGTTGKPKGVQRDTGGYAVALAASMAHIFFGKPGTAYFATSDIGWVVGHSYIVYGPLIAGMATILYEGTPNRPDAGVWWRLAEKYQVRAMFTAPTALRMLKKEDPKYLAAAKLTSLKALFVAGEPLDEPTTEWIAGALNVPILDNYWQTETGWPILTVAQGVSAMPARLGSPGVPVYGYDVRLVHEATGEDVGPGEKGVVAIAPPLPPGCLSTVWGDDERFVETYFKSIPGRLIYSTFDWGRADADGYVTILGRTDDVINVAGHRLGTREIEEAISTRSDVAEAAVVGVEDARKGQTPVAFVVLKGALPADPAALAAEVKATVASEIGPIARPSAVHFVTALPKTRSGKVVRRAVQALCEGRDPGDLSTLDDKAALDAVRAALG